MVISIDYYRKQGILGAGYLWTGMDGISGIELAQLNEHPELPV